MFGAQSHLAMDAGLTRSLHHSYPDGLESNSEWMAFMKNLFPIDGHVLEGGKEASIHMIIGQDAITVKSEKDGG